MIQEKEEDRVDRDLKTDRREHIGEDSLEDRVRTDKLIMQRIKLK